jgi:hypothetical protein
VTDTSSGPIHRTARWLLPSLTHWMWLLLLLILVAEPWRTTLVASDGDACMHWRVGEWMLQHKQIIRTDHFSHTKFGEPFISKEWLAEIIFAGAGRVAGLYGIAVVAALVIATTFALLHRQLLREGNDVLVASILTLLAAWAASTHWLARPHVFSFLLALGWNDALRRFERDGRSHRLALTLGILMLVWVNVHGAFLAGLFILGGYWLGAVIEFVRARDDAAIEAARHKIGVLSAVALFCIAVSLLNPNGYKLHLHNIQFLRSEYLTGWLNEYVSPNFQSPGHRGFLVWLAGLFFTLAWRRPRVSASALILLISWTYFALYAVRNIPLMVIVTAPIIAPALSEFVRGQWPEPSRRVERLNESCRGWPVVVTLAVAAIALVARPTELPAVLWPVKAVDFIKQNPERFAGNMFNQYGWGGYLMETLPEQKVFVDGRTDFYGEKVIREFSEVAGLATNWTETLDKYDVRWTLMPTGHRLNQALALVSDWRLAFSNETATIFSRNP